MNLMVDQAMPCLYSDCQAPASVVLVTWTGWLIERCPTHAHVPAVTWPPPPDRESPCGLP